MLVDILIRPAHPADAAGIIRLFSAVADERDSIGTEPGFDVAQRQSSILTSIKEGANCLLVAAREDVLVGSLGLQVQHNVGSLGMMVACQHRRQGIGGRLLDESLHWARERRLHKVDLHVWPHNAAAIALYRSRGFTVEGRLRRHYRRANGQLLGRGAHGPRARHAQPWLLLSRRRQPLKRLRPHTSEPRDDGDRDHDERDSKPDRIGSSTPLRLAVRLR
jgi:ribosomal protein S18 acetylase RimI-like enzyme